MTDRNRLGIATKPRRAVTIDVALIGRPPLSLSLSLSPMESSRSCDLHGRIEGRLRVVCRGSIRSREGKPKERGGRESRQDRRRRRRKTANQRKRANCRKLQSRTMRTRVRAQLLETGTASGRNENADGREKGRRKARIRRSESGERDGGRTEKKEVNETRFVSSRREKERKNPAAGVVFAAAVSRADNTRSGGRERHEGFGHKKKKITRLISASVFRPFRG